VRAGIDLFRGGMMYGLGIPTIDRFRRCHRMNLDHVQLNDQVTELSHLVVALVVDHSLCDQQAKKFPLSIK